MTDCETCGGQLEYLGRLGMRVHFRCIMCGMDQSCKFNELPEYAKEEIDEMEW